MDQKREYSQELQAAIFARANEIGIHAAAAEYGMAWQTLAWMRRKTAQGTEDAPAAKKESKKAGRKSGTATVRTEAPGAEAAGDREKTADELRAENAALRERIAKLEERINNFRNALAELRED